MLLYFEGVAAGVSGTSVAVGGAGEGAVTTFVGVEDGVAVGERANGVHPTPKSDRPAITNPSLSFILAFIIFSYRHCRAHLTLLIGHSPFAHL
jgi:hypothetical protein